MTTEFKTGHELLQMIEEVSPWVSEKIKINVKDQKNEALLLCRFKDAQVLVIQTFMWYKTREGHELWNNISQVLKFIK